MLTVIYRITSIPSSNPSPVHQFDKDALNKLCLNSFLKAFSDVDIKIIFLADHCDCKKMIRELCFSYDVDYQIISSESGINQTMIDSYEIASREDDCVLFNECDHLWLPDSGKKMYEAIKQLGLVSGYDHPDFYTRFDIHPKETEIVLVDGHHFRKSARNVMSWGCHSDLVRENIDILRFHGYLDGPVWQDLRERGHQLYTPIPSLSTHMVADYMAPGINWKKLWSNTQ